MFVVKAYWFGELASLYFEHSTPRSAQNQLRRWIDHNTELRERLAVLHFDGRKQRALTPMQVQAIVHYLGEP